MLRKALYLFTVTVLCFLTGCHRESPATEAPQKAKPGAASPRQVRVVSVVEDTVARGTVATGTLAAEDQVVLSFKVAGRLREISVDLGSWVRQGQTIARLDATDFRLRTKQAEATLQQARARLGLPPQGIDNQVDLERAPLVRQARAMFNEARQNHDRAVELWRRGLIARAELDTAATTFQVAEGRYQDALEEVRIRQAVLVERQSDLEIARQQLLDTALKAPMDGAVRQRHASVGEYLEEGAPVVTVVRMHPLRLQLSVPERVATGVRLGQPVHIKVEGDATVYEGKVTRLSPAISEQDRTLLLEAEVPNEHGHLRPGTFAEAEIITKAEAQAVLVPASAIIRFAGIEKVMLVEAGVSVEKRVQTGRRYGDRVEIVAGLKPADVVVVEPGSLVGGQPVTVRR
jgi:RND family efflux transporter MFP subunit